MHFFAALPFLLSVVVAIPVTSKLSIRQSSTTCGSDQYTAADVSAAADASCSLIKQGAEAGSSKYPEKYNDYEDFSFNGVAGPYYEFPIMSNGDVYDGGAPGADRVVITSDCTFAGVITHTGASGDDFVACSGTD